MNPANDIYDSIAQRVLGIRTLKPQNSDAADFHELHFTLIFFSFLMRALFA